jgi:hypothetical protein
MREKLLWSIAVLLGLTLIASYAQPPVRPESQVGRFQIVVAPPGGGQQAQVFRLDTATGKTSVKALTGDNILVWSAAMSEQTQAAREVPFK